MKLRTTLMLAASATMTVAHGQWSVTILDSRLFSDANGAFGSVQVGRTGGHAKLWTGTEASAKDIHPTGLPAGRSEAFAIFEDRIGGSVSGRATLWTRRGLAFADCHPLDTDESLIAALTDTLMGGYVIKNGAYHATLWSDPQTSINLHPSGIREHNSRVLGMAGSVQVGYVFDPNFAPRACKWNGTANSWTLLDGPVGSIARATNGVVHVGSINNAAAMWIEGQQGYVRLSWPYFYENRCNALWGDYQVGLFYVQDYPHAYLWRGTAESAVDLGAMLPGNYVNSEATGMSSDGLYVYVTGHASTGSSPRVAVLWSKPGPENFYLDLNKSSVVGENTVIGTISMFGTTPTDTRYEIYDDSALVTTPNSVTVPAGSTTKTFLIGVKGITSTVNTTIFGRRGRLTRSHPLRLSPLVPTAISFSPSLVTGGQTVTGRVYINGVAPAGGRIVSLFDDSTKISEPSVVTIPAGATSVAFSITSLPVTRATDVRVTARVSAGEKSAILRVVP
ncbi:MAG: hypothetical protein ABL949_03380 [Fimbriimonadaceae bacterium]